MKKFFFRMIVLSLAFCGILIGDLVNCNNNITEVNADGSSSTLPEVSTKPLIEIEPAITIFTHGLGGHARDWSNSFNGSRGSIRFFEKDSESIIEKMRDSSDEEIKLYRYSKNSYYDSINKETYSEGIYPEYEFKPASKLKKITDFSKHTIVAVEINTWQDSIKLVYDDFRNIVNDVLDSYKNTHSNQETRINLVGHSMGGLINMQYAIEYPERVASLISLGTPYEGSWYDNPITEHLLEMNDFNDMPCMGGTCHHDYYFCDLNKRKEAWNTAYNLHKNIKFYALTGQTSSSLLQTLISRGEFSTFHNVEGFFAGAALFIGNALINVGDLLPGDVCVDLNSQSARGYDGVINYNKIFNSENSNLENRSQNDVGFPHNLETYDSDMINLILNTIYYGKIKDQKEYNPNNEGIGVKLLCKFNHKWVIKLTNYTDSPRCFEYCSKMCSQDMAVYLAGAGYMQSTTVIPVGGSTIIEISDYIDEKYITISYNDQHVRHIFYGYNLDASNLTMDCGTNSKSCYIYIGNCIEVSIISKFWNISNNDSIWFVKLSNNTNDKQTFIYNSRLCFEKHAKEWNELDDIKTCDLEKGQSTILAIEENGTAGTMAISYIKKNERNIFYAYNLNYSGTMSDHTATTSWKTYDEDGITVGIVGKNKNTWILDLTNNTKNKRNFEYNTRMCFLNHAKEWVDLTDVQKTVSLDVGETIRIEISENGFAGTIAISYVDDNSRSVFYADNLNDNCTLTSHHSKPSIYWYEQYEMLVNIVGKKDGVWTIKLINNSNSSRVYYYNRKMCSFGDAEIWNGLEDIETTEAIPSHECIELSIAEYGTASSIAISYLEGETRYIFYAKDLNPKGTMSDYKNTSKCKYSSHHGLEVRIIGKTGSDWIFEVKNNTKNITNFEYNNRMCDFDHAQNWCGLLNKRSITIGKGKTAQIKIQENGTATSITISYVSNYYRYVFYANHLDDNCTMDTYENVIDERLIVEYSNTSGNNKRFKLTNHTGERRDFYYNGKEVYENYAKNWKELGYIKTININNNDYGYIDIENVSGPETIAISYVEGNTRNIYYAYDVTKNNIKCYRTTTPYNPYESKGVKINILSKINNTWFVEITNNTGVDRAFSYNKKMCFEGDAQNWTGLCDIARTDVIGNGKTTIVSIDENYAATNIAISYTEGNKRYVLYGNELSLSNFSISGNSTDVDYNFYNNDERTLRISIVGKDISTWIFDLTNISSQSLDISYNTKLCFESDAKEWKNLSDINSSLRLKPNETATIRISENGFAGTFAISYKTSDNKRHILYGYDLNKKGTMTKKCNIKDENASSSDSNCITKGTLITLADGTQKKVEDLTGDEMLLVWNIETGNYDVSPILFIDKDPEAKYEFITLTFSDGTKVEVVSEHGFFDKTLNKYVYLDKDAAQYIGHTFVKQGNNDRTKEVTLKKVKVATKTTTTYSPVTYGNLCYYVNGMLSMPGGISGLFNYFEIDPNTMAYDKEAMARDIETYGLFTYEEVNELAPISREMFDAVNGQYLKVAIGKGLLTPEYIEALAARYSVFVPDDEETAPAGTEVNKNTREYVLNYLAENKAEFVDAINQYLQSYTGKYWVRMPYESYDSMVINVNFEGEKCFADVAVVWGGNAYNLRLTVNVE